METPDIFYKNTSLLNSLLESSKKDDFSTFIRLEKSLFYSSKEVDFLVYKDSIIEFLLNNSLREDCVTFANSIIKEDYITYIKNITRNIAVFPGSFNPFTTGHLSILEKAEKVFDKVIIAFGKNSRKNDEKYEIPQTIMNRQIAHYDGLFSTFIDNLGYEVTVIRGLRNAFDLQTEIVFERCLKDEIKDPHKMKFVYITCDADTEHISSTVAREYSRKGIKKYTL